MGITAEKSRFGVIANDTGSIIFRRTWHNPQFMASASQEFSAAKINAALAEAIRRGSMSDNQYRYLAQRILDGRPCSLLVFGAGYDAELWRQCAEGSVAYVEDDPVYLTLAPAGARVLMYEYPSRVGLWSKVPSASPLISQGWDYVLVDGPRGYNRVCPGRQISITWARKLAQRQIFVHDYERTWERTVCDRMLGPAVQRLAPDAGRRGELAVFDVDAIRTHDAKTRERL